MERAISIRIVMTVIFRSRNICQKISQGRKFYPGNNAREEELRKYLRALWGEKYGY